MTIILEDVFREAVVSGLVRNSIHTPSQWASAYRIMGQPFAGPWTFKRHPWCRVMHDNNSPVVVGQKAAQMGYTEIALNKSFFTIDVLGESVLYVLPASTPDASDFSTSRFDPALELSPHLEHLFTDVKNIGHKRAGNANLFIRGSRSRSQLKSIPVGLVILDEVDEMVQENVPLAFERMSGREEKQALLISTPTIDNYGINQYFQRSSQNYYYFRCPSCSRFICLEYPQNLVITAENLTDPRLNDTHLICHRCKGVLQHEKKTLYFTSAEWVPSFTDRDIAGYHISQLYSTTVHPKELAASFLRGLFNPADEQEFHNSKLGNTHAAKGAKITDEQIESCIGTYTMLDCLDRQSLTTIGIDVGKWLHYEIGEWLTDPKASIPDINHLAVCRVLKVGKVLNFEELDSLIRDFKCLFAIIDAEPEQRKSLEFCQKYWMRAKMCYYARGVIAKQIHVHKEEECSISVNRTSWLDMSLGRFKNTKVILPKDIPLEYRQHIKAPVRIYEKDSDGNPVGKYIKGNEDDHYAHAHNYNEMALKFAATLARSENIGRIL